VKAQINSRAGFKRKGKGVMLYPNLVEGYDKFYKTLDSAKPSGRLSVMDMGGTAITEEIFFQLCKIHYIGWKHRVTFKRNTKISIPELFQDIVAFYLKVLLPKEYEVLLEEKSGKIKPDILIKKNGSNHFAIEVKTNVGFARIDESKPETIAQYEERVNAIADAFEIPKKNIIYIFETHHNNGRGFSEKYWDKNKKERTTKRPADSPYSIIYPLFDQADPYYWEMKEYKKITDETIKNKAKENIVTPFEEIINLITQRQEKPRRSVR
jgi:hypothetical protein